MTYSAILLMPSSGVSLRSWLRAIRLPRLRRVCSRMGDFGDLADGEEELVGFGIEMLDGGDAEGPNLPSVLDVMALGELYGEGALAETTDRNALASSRSLMRLQSQRRSRMTTAQSGMSVDDTGARNSVRGSQANGGARSRAVTAAGGALEMVLEEEGVSSFEAPVSDVLRLEQCDAEV